MIYSLSQLESTRGKHNLLYKSWQIKQPLEASLEITQGSAQAPHLGKFSQAAEASREGKVATCLVSALPGEAGLLPWGAVATAYFPIGQCEFPSWHTLFKKI